MTSLDLGPLVLGGNVFGWTADRDQSFAILDAFVEGGGRSIDTADVYSQWVEGNTGGDSEAVIGAWLADRGRRDAVEIHTKVFSKSDRPGLSARNIVLAAEDSLRRLQTDHLDLYYAHRDDPEVEQEEYVVAFDALVQSGKVREVGASNFTSDRLRSALAVASEQGLTGFTVAQDKWNLMERDIEVDLLPVLVREDVVELPYAGLAGGFLTGKYRPGRPVESARAAGAARYLDRPGAVQLLEALDSVAAAHDSTPTSVALAWLAAQPAVGAPIASARTVDQVAPLLASARLTLSGEELARLSAASSVTTGAPVG
jgi:aryl-alcohol dehydrogenase-like predicted oxidoreductase